MRKNEWKKKKEIMLVEGVERKNRELKTEIDREIDYENEWL